MLSKITIQTISIMKKSFLLTLLLVSCQCIFAAGLTIGNLRVNGSINPLGVGDDQPIFSWSVADGDLKGVKTQSFRVQVYSDSRCTKRIWDSRSQQSSNTWILGPYFEGVEGTKYYWRVIVNDNKGRQITSKTAWFVLGLNGSGWSGAKWIKGKESTYEAQDGVTVMRKKISTATDKRKIKSATVFAAALGEFEMYLNGQRLGHEGIDEEEIIYDELKAGWAAYNAEVPYVTFDITNLIQKGDNMLGAQIANGWWKGGITKGIYNQGDPALLAKVIIFYNDSTVDSLVTDQSWEVNNCGPVLYGDIYNGETYDARKDYSWTTLGDKSTGWKPAELAPDFPGEIVAFHGPTINIRPEYEQTIKKVTIYKGTKQTGTTHGAIDVIKELNGPELEPFTLHAGETAIIDLGQNMTGWPLLNIKGGSGTEVVCRFGEMLNDDGSDEHKNDGPAGSVYFANLRSAKATLKYIMNGNALGEEYHPSTTFFGFRYILMTASSDVTVNNVKGQVVGSNIPEYAEFSCSDESINQLYSNIRWGARSNFLSVPTDCPQRDERLGWTGDTQIFSRTACYNADMKSFYMKWMRDLRNSQNEEGAFPDVAPLGCFGGFGNAGWADAGIIVPWIVYMMYGDSDILEENYEAMQRYMLWLQSNTDSKYLYNGANTAYGDWLAYEPLDKRYISVCYYAYVADLMARISSAIGKEEEFDNYEALAEEIRNEFRSRYLKDDHILVDNTGYKNNEINYAPELLAETSKVGNAPMTAYVLALHFNMLETEEQYKIAAEELRQKIVNNGYKLSTGFIGTAYLLTTLSEYGMSDLAYTLLQQRENPSWLFSVDQGATTIWERWDSFKTGEGFNKHEWNMNSFNHYAYGVVGEWIYRDMVGVDTDYEQPGFKHFYLDPKIDNRTELLPGQKKIDWVKCSFETVLGRLTCDWERQKDGSIKYHIVVPFNCTATWNQLQKDGTYKEVTLECGKYDFKI